MMNNFMLILIFQSSRICDSSRLRIDWKPRFGTFRLNLRSEYVKRNQNRCSCLSKREPKASNFSQIQKKRSSGRKMCSALRVLVFTLYILLALMETVRRRLIWVRNFFFFNSFASSWSFPFFTEHSLGLFRFRINYLAHAEKSAVKFRNTFLLFFVVTYV
jgi:hypothetical protein